MLLQSNKSNRLGKWKKEAYSILYRSMRPFPFQSLYNVTRMCELHPNHPEGIKTPGGVFGSTQDLKNSNLQLEIGTSTTVGKAVSLAPRGVRPRRVVYAPSVHLPK